MNAGDKAIEALRLLSSVADLGDFIYDVREREGLGWEGPKVTAWSKGVTLAKEALKEAATP